MGKLTIKMPYKFMEFNYYAKWYSKSKNLKTRRKLLIKCAKLINSFDCETLIIDKI